MVQYKSIYTNPHPSHSDHSKDYWKLNNYTNTSAADIRRRLDERGIQYNKSSKHARLSTIISRVERNLLIYDKCTIAELREFYRSRREPGDPACPNRKADIIAQLEQKDENPNLSEFLNLPPEMRTMIYEKHLESLSCAGTPYAPPLTYVNKQLHDEALPVFLQATPFTLDFGFHHHGTGSRAVATTWQRTFFARGPVDHIHKLHLKGRLEQQTRGWEVNVELEHEKIKSLGRAISRCERRHGNPNQDDEAKAVVQANVDALLTTMAARGQGLQLRRGDLPALLSIFSWQP